VNRLKVNLVLCLAAIYTLMAALYPFEFSGRTLTLDGSLPRELLSLLLVRVRDVGPDDFLTNIVYFLPWGVLVYVLQAPQSRKLSAVFRAALVGGMVSLTIEVCQIFFTRHPSIFDVVANTLGAGLGALFCAFSSIDLRRVMGRSLAWAAQSRLVLPAALLFAAMPLGISLSKYPALGLDVWDWHYTFQHRRAVAPDSPWFGMVHGAAVYERALEPGEIAQKYRLGASNGALRRRANTGLIIFCTFSDNRGNQLNGDFHCGSPLHLALIPRSRYRWLHGGNGIEIFKPAVLRSERPATDLFEAIRGRSELSVEAWMTRANLDSREARGIRPPSPYWQVRNVAARRDGAEIDFRVGGRVSGRRSAELESRNGSLTLEQFHLVVTYEGGVRRLFVNGQEHPYNHFDLRLADFIVAFGNNPVAQTAYSFLFFFPLSLFFSRALAKRSAAASLAWLAAVTIAFGFLTMTEALQARLFARSVDLVFAGYGLAVVAAGALCGILFAKETPARREDSPPFGQHFPT
jgi:hypothetical protein